MKLCRLAAERDRLRVAAPRTCAMRVTEEISP
jgi:hypothetical protein